MSDRIDAVLIPPQLARFREICGVDDELEAVFRGWSKFVLLSRDRAFVFPRHAHHVEPLEREVEILNALARCGLEFVPRVLGRWVDESIYPYPFIATNRLPGTSYEDIDDELSLDQMLTFMRSLGAVIARWQSVATPDLPPEFRDHDNPFQGVLGDLTARESLSSALREAEEVLTDHVPGGSLRAWSDRLAPLTELAPTLVHGDVCDNQFIVDDSLNVTGVLDWGGAHVGTPLRDFLFGEWSLEFYEVWEQSFAAIREAMWDGYREHRSILLPGADAVHVLFSIAEACFFVDLAAWGEPTSWQRHRLEQSVLNLREAI